MNATITYKFRWTTPKKNISAGDVVKPKTLSQQEHPEKIYKAMIHKQEATHMFKRGDSKLKAFTSSNLLEGLTCEAFVSPNEEFRH